MAYARAVQSNAGVALARASYAACLAALMVFAIVFHAQRAGEGPNIVFNAILGLIAALVAYGRFVVAPSDRAGRPRLAPRYHRHWRVRGGERWRPI